MRYQEVIEYLLTNHVQGDAEDPNIGFMIETLQQWMQEEKEEEEEEKKGSISLEWWDTM